MRRPHRRARRASLPWPAIAVSCLGLCAFACDSAGTGPASGASCPARPTAYVFDPEASSAAVEALRAAGFEVQVLPLDISPERLRGLILLGTDAASDPRYAGYMQQYAGRFFDFVDRANVLLQMPQPPELEEVPPILPRTHRAHRTAGPSGQALVAQPQSVLLAGVALDGQALAWMGGVADQAFDLQGGFEVILVGDGEGDADAAGRPLLMEGAYGQGRIILSALPFDVASVGAPEEQTTFTHAFFDNLYTHVQDVCLRSTPALIVTPSSTEDFFEKDSWKLAVLPDTQVYSLLFPGLFTAQTAWIAAKAEQLDIRYTIHLGDIVNNNTDFEWERALGAMTLLEGHIPYALVPGNHDYGPTGDATTRDTLLNEYFMFDASAAMPTFGGAFEPGQLDNTYHLFSAGGRDYIIMALEWGPRDEVIAWANEIMSEHADRDGIFVTHAYLNYDDRRYDHTDMDHDQSYNPHVYATPGGVNDGEELWQKLVRRHRFVITLSGHVLNDGEAYLVSETDLGNRCHQMLSNYQTRVLGGEGYMRILEFLSDGETVRVSTYSPLYDDFLREPAHNFSFVL